MILHSLTAADLVTEIEKLGLDRPYKYISDQNTIQIRHVVLPEGPISFERLDKNGQPRSGNISPQQLTKIAQVCQSKPNFPLHIDRIFSAGGNSRSALETLLAHTPNFFVCYPQRIDNYTGKTRADLKHIMWCPEDSHALGVVVQKEYRGIINEIEASIDFGDIVINDPKLDEFASIESQRLHVQIQVALIEIGSALGLNSWIARNDHATTVKGKRLIDFPDVIPSLEGIRLLYEQSIRDAASLIDCIWFTKDLRNIAAVLEIEHSTGVTSGLTRMLKFQRSFPAVKPTFVVVAPNELRGKVVNEVNQEIFSSLDSRFMPYSNVRELYGLTQRYPISGLIDFKFALAFME